MVSKIVWDGVVRETAACCCCISEDAARSMNLFGNPFAARLPTDAAINPEWLVLWTTTGEERIIFGGDDMVIWVRAGEMVDDWIGSEIVVVVITELGRWVNSWSLGFSLGDAGILLRKEANGCFGGVACWEWSNFDASVCPWGIIMSAKSNIVTAGFDWRLSDNGGDFTVTDFWAVSFWARFNSAITDTVWGFCSGPDLLTAVVSILVTLAVVVTGLCTGMTVARAAIVGLISASPSDCARFFKTDKAVAVVANEAEIAGTAAGAVVEEVIPVPTTDGVALATSFTSALPTF